jgi:hypothetical protein
MIFWLVLTLDISFIGIMFFEIVMINRELNSLLSL